MKNTSGFRKIERHTEKFINTLVDSGEIEIVQKTVQAGSVLILFILTITFFCLFLFFICIGLTMWIGRQVNSYVLASIFLGIIFLSAFSFLTIWNKSIVLSFFQNKLTRYLAGHADDQVNSYPG